MTNHNTRIGIIGAMHSEIAAVLSAMTVEEQGHSAGFAWWRGQLGGRPVVLARGGMGKVAAAACAQRLIDCWDVQCLIVCGLAGGVDERLRPGDIVIGDRLMQHDVDASPIFPRFQLPGLDLDTLMPPADLVDAAEAAAQAFLLEEPLDPAVRAANGIGEPRVLRGLIATGDQFIEDGERAVIRAALPDAVCVEMEGAAIAQVCYLNQIPCVVIRVMSDNADDGAAFDFLRFVDEVAPGYLYGIVRRLLPVLPV